MLAELAEALAGGRLGAFLLMVGGTVTPVPAELPALLVAMHHPLGAAFLLIWSGAMAGALVVYAVAAGAGQRFALLGRWAAVDRARARLCAVGWLGIFAVRLVPLVPFLAVSIAAGLLRLPLQGFLVGTGLGIVPGCLVMALLGRGLIDEDRGLAALSLGLAAGIALLLVLLRRSGRLDRLAPPGDCP
jgi:uncharacterized membrane protein YdjX (TVP38/TMEM64 family)